VLVLDQGKEIFYGPTAEAKPFMEDLGFVCADGANVADFLTGVTVPTERQIRDGYEDRYPRNADEVRAAYEKTKIKSRMEGEYDYPSSDQAKAFTDDFREGVQAEKHKSLPKKSPLTTSFYTQVYAAVIRQYQLLWGDKSTLFIKQFSTIAQALIAGSLFYNSPSNSSGLFVKGGALFFALLYNALVAMNEVTDSFTARPILAKHRGFAYFHPAAFCVAQIAADIPLIVLQVTLLSLPIYWLTGLKATASAFFTFWAILFATSMAVTALFRAIGAGFKTFDAASKVSGFTVSALIMYIGYMLPKPDMHPWFVWYVVTLESIKH
jgi:ABC-type multidrug transport system permease subunit